MCGRYFIDAEMMEEIGRITRNAGTAFSGCPTGDIRPSDRAPVLRQKGERILADGMRWGFFKETQSGLLINARAESALERKSFRDSVRFRRCVLPSRKFYEWNREKEKAAFEREDRGILYMAGFFDLIRNQERFVILTTEANRSVAPVHHRMPLVLEEDEWREWLDVRVPAERFLEKRPVLLKREQEYEQQTLPFLQERTEPAYR